MSKHVDADLLFLIGLTIIYGVVMFVLWRRDVREKERLHAEYHRALNDTTDVVHRIAMRCKRESGVVR